jgi:hypothetical protein
MGEVIYGRFSSEKAWQQAHQRLTKTLLVVGELFGDKDQVLLRAKADLAHTMIREIVEEAPVTDLTFDVPESLSQEQCDDIKSILNEAVSKGIEIATRHSVQVLANSIYDLCTSKLASQPRTDDP